MLRYRKARRLQRVREQHNDCQEAYDMDLTAKTQAEQEKNQQLIEIMNRKKKDQEELLDCVEADSLLESGHDLESGYVPSSSVSSDNENHDGYTKLKFKKKCDKLREVHATSPTKTLTDANEKLKDTDDIDRDRDDHDTDYSADDENEERSQMSVKCCIKGEKRKWDKRHYCVYCKKTQSKIAQHLMRKHSDEKEVALATNLPPSSKKSRQMLEGLRRKGNYYHNIEMLQKGQDKLWKHEKQCCKMMGEPEVQSKKRRRIPTTTFSERSFKSAEDSDEEVNILTRRPLDEKKRTEKTGKRQKRVSEPVEDSDEDIDVLTQNTVTGRPSDEMKKSEKRGKRISEPVEDSDEEVDVLTQNFVTGRPSDEMKKSEKRGKRRKRVSEPVEDSDEEVDVLTQNFVTGRPSDEMKKNEKRGLNPQFRKKKKCHRRPWSFQEKAAVWRQLGRYIIQQRVPGKELCVKAIEAEQVLCSHNWKDVKNQVYKFITSQKSKQL